MRLIVPCMLLAAPAFPACPDLLTATQIEDYWRQGWLAFEQALTADEVAAARAALSTIVYDHVSDPTRSEFRPGKVRHSNQCGAEYHSRTSRMFFQLEPGFEPGAADAREIELQIRKFMHFEHETPLFEQMTTVHAKTRGLLPTILGGPVVLYQCMALIKPPRIGSEKPWHQDNAYFSVKNMDGVIGTWIALDDVTVENGCMHVLSGAHRAGPLQHHHTFDCEIRPDRFDKSAAVPIELKAGGILIFHGNLPHQTPRNDSDHRRRALQFHYRRTDNEVISHEEYDRIFAEADGAPASCAAARRNGF
jgi:phytanoyl-CoA hydroxylase